jgi:glucose uptake protein
MIFNLGNMLLTSSMSISGLSVAFPVALSAAMIVSTVVSMVTGVPMGNNGMVIGGMAMLAGAIVTTTMGNNILGVLHHEVMARAGKVKSTRRPSSIKPVLIALFGGLILGSYFNFVDRARDPDVGMGPYTITVLFALGATVSTLVYSIFFINLPVHGEPAELSDFGRTSPGSHFKAFLAGGVLSTGILAILVSDFTADLSKDHRIASGFIGHAAALVAVFWGVAKWKELREGDMRVKIMMLMTIILFAGGVLLLAIAPTQIVKPT